MVIYYNPIPYAYWLPIVHVAIDGSILYMYGFIGRLVEDTKRLRLERAFLFWTLLISISHFVVPRDYFWPTAYRFHLIGTVALAAIVIRIAFIAIKTRNSQSIIITTAMLVKISLFLQNLYLFFSRSTAQWEGSMFYAHYGVPLLFFIFIGTLIRRFVIALRTAEELNQELEKKWSTAARLSNKILPNDARLK
jgi:hypothetical protein